MWDIDVERRIDEKRRIERKGGGQRQRKKDI